jgi:hypothetical protein
MPTATPAATCAAARDTDTVTDTAQPERKIHAADAEHVTDPET